MDFLKKSSFYNFKKKVINSELSSLFNQNVQHNSNLSSQSTDSESSPGANLLLQSTSLSTDSDTYDYYDGLSFDLLDEEISQVFNYESSTSTQEFNPNSIDSHQLSSNLINLTSNTTTESLDNILKELLTLQVKSKLPFSVMESILKIIDHVLKIVNSKDSNFKMPKSYYHFKKFFDLNIGVTFGFKTDCCSTFTYQQKDSNNEFTCSNSKCKTNKIKSTDVFLKRDYFFFYDFAYKIQLMLNKFKLIQPNYSNSSIESHFDSNVFKKINAQKNGDILAMTCFADGANLFNSEVEDLWPIFLRLDNLECPESSKIMLVGCHIGEKPDVKIYLESFVDVLNHLFDFGITIDGRKIYPVVTNFVLDLEAKYPFMCHVRHNTYYGCTQCFAKGINIFLQLIISLYLIRNFLFRRI